MATRDGILDAAEQLFAERGVSRTSLQDIAQACGVTRGAIYWHFRDKGALFTAMMDRAMAPLESLIFSPDTVEEQDLVAYVRRMLLAPMELMFTQPQIRAAFDIAMNKAEYVGELASARDRHLAIQERCLQRTENAFRLAIERGQLAARLPPRTLAVGLLALISGLKAHCFMHPEVSDPMALCRQLIDDHLDGLRAAPAPATASGCRG